MAADSCRAWKEFLALSGKSPWEATVADVEAYVEALQKRKLRPATVKVRLAGLTKFYEYCQAQQIDGECEAGFNPVRGARRPKVKDYEKANYLSRKEEAALLETIRQDPSPMGKRDYALILMLITTGWKSGQVRNLQWTNLEEWKDLRGEEGIGDKGGASLRLGTGEVWEAVREYLEATGRWEGIGAEEYVFAPSRTPLVREAGEGAEDWDGSRPLSGDELHYLVKLHAGRAGLKAEKITCHTLRHTAVMRQVEAGADAPAVGTMLGMKWAGNVKVYTRRLKEKPKGRLRARKRVDSEIWPGLPPLLMGEAARPTLPPGSGQVRSRGPFRAWRRNHLGLKHGFYARYLPEFEWLAELGFKPKGLDGSVVRWRVVMQRAAILGNDVTTLKEGLRVLKVLGMASVRLGKALKFRKELRDEEREREWQEYLWSRSE